MKKTLILLSFILIASLMQAQNADLLQRIKAAGDKVKSFET